MLTPTLRYPCCEHCIGEGCPRLAGHDIPCGTKGCFSGRPIIEQTTTPLSHAMEDIMGWREEENLRQLKEDLVDQATSILGHEPAGIRSMLKLLSHPSIIGNVRRYLEALDADAIRCLHYEAPWNCIREADAKYQNMQYGYVGGPMVGVDDSWCESCLSKVMGRPSIEEVDCAEG